MRYFVPVILKVLLIITQAYSWKLQLCLNGTIYETNSDSCKYGFWFTEPMVVHKICFERGVWAVYKEFCEDDPIIFTVRPGTRGCMRHDELGKRIMGAVPIGQDERSGGIISTSHRRLFFSNRKLKKGMHVTFVNEPEIVEILTWGPPSVKFSFQQRINNDRGIVQQCLIKGQYSFFGYYRVRLESSINASFFLAKNVCYAPLSSQIGEGGRRTQLLPSEIDFDILQSSLDGDTEGYDLKCEQYGRIDEGFEKDSDDISTLLAREANGKIMSPGDVHMVEKRVDQETHKIAERLMAVHFTNDTFDMKFDTWKFLDIVKEIFLTACPALMVRPFFVNQIYLLFQAILHESFLQFPNHQDKDKDTSDRIQETLEKCSANSTQLEFKVGKNCTDEAPLLIKTFPNGTQYYLLVEMPSFIKVDGVNYDLLMESIWKLMNFAHYYCADYFQELASDHSILEGHWYRLFSPLIIRRWKYPGKGYLLFKKLFMSIDLEKSIRNLDFCVSAARLHSSYKGWLKRPLSHIDLASRDSSLTQIWDDHAYCMTDYMDPALKFPNLNFIEKCGIRKPTNIPKNSPKSGHTHQKAYFTPEGTLRIL